MAALIVVPVGGVAMLSRLGLTLVALMLLPGSVIAVESSADPADLETAATEYLAASEWRNARMDELYEDEEIDSDELLLMSAQIDEDLHGRLSQIRFPDNVRPSIDALLALMEESVRLQRQWAADFTDVDLALRLDELDEEVPVAINELRSALGLEAAGEQVSIGSEESSVAFVGGWTVGPLEVDPLTDQVRTLTYLNAEPGSTATLVIACVDDRTDLWIDWGGYIDDPLVDVALRVDRGDVHEEEWIATGESTFYSHAEDLVASLIGHAELVAGMSGERAIFGITDIEEAVARVRKACEW